VNSKSYKNLVKNCNHILMQNKNFFRFALTGLNIIRPHPKYININNQVKKIKIPNLLSRYFNEQNLKLKKINNLDFVIISSLTNRSDLKKKYPIFEHFINRLIKKRKKYFILYRNFSNRRISKKVKNKFIININHNFNEYFLNLLKIFFELFYLIISFNTNFTQKKIIIKLFSFNNLRSSLYTLNEVKHLNNLINNLRPKKVLMTLEGYPWERLLANRLKKNYANIKIFGYFFSVMTRFHNFPFYSFGKEYDLDYILTSGIPAKKKFVKKNFEHNKVFVIGTNRYKKNTKRKKMQRNKVILLPEAFHDEVKLFINYSKKINEIDNKFQFYIKLHPSMNNKKDINFTLKLIDKMNIKIVTNEQSEINFGYAIFRGSTSIIEFIKKGSIPFYLKKKNEINFNPLYEIQNFIPSIIEPNDFIKHSKNQKRINKKTVNYCENYFIKPQNSLIDKIISG